MYQQKYPYHQIMWGISSITLWLLAVILHQQVQDYFSFLAAQWGFQILQHRILLFWWLAGILGLIIWIFRDTSSIKPHKKSVTICLWVGFCLVSLCMWFTYSKTRAESIHFIQYAVLCMVLYQACSRLWMTTVLVALLGLVDESVQAFVTAQSLDLVDVVFNALGSVLGALCLWQWKGRNDD